MAKGVSKLTGKGRKFFAKVVTAGKRAKDVLARKDGPKIRQVRVASFAGYHMDTNRLWEELLDRNIISEGRGLSQKELVSLAHEMGIKDEKGTVVDLLKQQAIFNSSGGKFWLDKQWLKFRKDMSVSLARAMGQEPRPQDLEPLPDEESK